MNGHLFNKIQYNFFAKHLKADLGRVKTAKSCQWVIDTHRIGRIVDGYWLYTEKDRAAIIQLVKSQLNVDLLFDAYPAQQSRIENAVSHNDEKMNALAVSKDFVLVNSLNNLQINSKILEINAFSSLGIYINANKIETIEHKHIVLVENLAVMANLAKLVLLDNAKHLVNALWVYRGDVKREQSTGRAYDFFRRFKGSHQLLCFADCDPEGIKIAMTSGASTMLSPNSHALINFNVGGHDLDYFKQDAAKQYLMNKSNQGDFPLELDKLLTVMSAQRQTIKQEHILAHQIPLSVFTLD
ncbi:hypothetical protein [uncultured Psychromonas sp.]|uniref:DUF7281 domain-containing protein n=1 Tax=uncultured Psychromonas sp. TaxID=173974 RepID=UPI00260AD32F|nr:hypothetical protein [uncultured Psychromonas sp.]